MLPTVNRLITRRNWLKWLSVAPVLAACNASTANTPDTAVDSVEGAQPVLASAGANRVTDPTLAPTRVLSTPAPVASALQLLMIEAQRQQTYPGSDISIERSLPPGPSYDRFVVSYRSEGLKIYALMTVPRGDKPAGGWPVIVFNHGYIPPDDYRTTERYVSYVDGFAHHGYIVFKSDYRGHGNSEGKPRSYGYPDFTTDVLNAVASLKNHPQAAPGRIGMWGHSMGGYLTLRAMVISKDIRAGNIWAGVVGSYEEIADLWFSRQVNPVAEDGRSWREAFFAQHGSPAQNPDFWNAISATSYLKDLSGPLQLHHAFEDTDVPIEMSRQLIKRAQAAKQVADLTEYKNDNHNISVNFEKAMAQSLSFFQQHLA